MPSQSSAKSTGSGVLDGLKGVFQQISQLQLEPDAAAHMQILQGLQKAIMGYLQQQMQQKAAQAAQMSQLQAGAANAPGGPGGGGGAPPGGPGGPGMGGPPPGGFGGPPGGPPGSPGGSPSQGSPGIAMPNPDELRRVLATMGGPGTAGG